MNKLIFLDRDGTVIKDYDDELWKEVKCIEPINTKLLEFLIASECTLVFISNQYLMEEGYLANEKFKLLDMQFRNYLEIKHIKNYEIKYAFESREKNDYLTKPNAGMVIEYIQENKLSDFRNLIFIGDSKVDKEMAQNLQIKFFDISELGEDCVIEELKKLL